MKTKQPKTKDWKEELKKALSKEFHIFYEGILEENIIETSVDNYIKIAEPIIESLLSEEGRKIVEEIVKLSDEIEMEMEDGTTQWRGFKHLRNTLRDKYLSRDKI